MADQKTTQNAPTQFTAEHLERVSSLLQGIKGDARQAADQGDAFMLSVYNDIIRVVSPIVVRATARLERSERAAINKAHKNLRKAARTNSDASAQA